MKAKIKNTMPTSMPPAPYRPVIVRVIPMVSTPWKEAIVSAEKEERRFQNTQPWIKILNPKPPDGGGSIIPGLK